MTGRSREFGRKRPLDRTSWQDLADLCNVHACRPTLLRYRECRGLHCAEPRAAVARAAARGGPRGCAPPPCASHRLCHTPRRSQRTVCSPAGVPGPAPRGLECMAPVPPQGVWGAEGKPGVHPKQVLVRSAHSSIRSKPALSSTLSTTLSTTLRSQEPNHVQSLLSPRRSKRISAAPRLRGCSASSCRSLFLSAASFTPKSRLRGPLLTHSSSDRAKRTVSFATRSPPPLHTRISLLRVTAHARTADASEFGE